jgi:general secretion pathway protein I
MEGFTLVEVLAAFMILAATLAVAHSSLSTGLLGTTRAQEVLHATAAAQSVLAEVGLARPLADGRSRFALDGDWVVRVDTSRLGPPSEAGIVAWSVVVEVAPTADGAALVGLETIRLEGLTREPRS